MQATGGARTTRNERRARHRIRSDYLETGVLVTLAGLVVFKGAAAIGGIALATGEMMVELLRVLAAG